MALRSRPMQPGDVRECAAIIAMHPVIGPRYGRAIKDLAAALQGLLGSEALSTVVFEEVEGAQARTFGFGVGAFVTDDFMREIKTPPLFWFGPELGKRVAAGQSPILSDREVREANTKGGLNLLVWEAPVRPEFATRADALRLTVNTYIESYRGFHLKEMTCQMESAQRLQWAVDAGGMLWNPINKCYVKSPRESFEQVFEEPHIVGLTRELEFERPGSLVGGLFYYQRPQFGFSPREQRLLITALGGESQTDQELARALHIALPTVKKMWLSIYRRVADRKPELVHDRSHAETETSERGREKRRRLLVYIREHPEELHPVSRRLLEERQPVAGAIHRARG